MALGLPSFLRLEATWTEAQNVPASLHAKQRAMYYVLCVSESHSCYSACNAIPILQDSQVEKQMVSLITALGYVPRAILEAVPSHELHGRSTCMTTTEGSAEKHVTIQGSDEHSQRTP